MHLLPLFVILNRTSALYARAQTHTNDLLYIRTACTRAEEVADPAQQDVVNSMIFGAEQLYVCTRVVIVQLEERLYGEGFDCLVMLARLTRKDNVVLIETENDGL